MTDFLAFVTDGHDARFLWLAAAICASGAVVSTRALLLVLAAGEDRAVIWALLFGVISGSIIWATQLLAILAYHGSTDASFAPWSKALSLILPVLVGSTAALLAQRQMFRALPEIPGLLFGLGLAGAHYISLMGLSIRDPGHAQLGVTALVIGCALIFGVLTFNRVARPVTRFCRFGGAVSLVLGILSTHFVGMYGTATGGTLFEPTDWDGARGSLVVPVLVIATLVVVGGSLTSTLDFATRRAADAQLADAIRRDPLTGLLNRRGLDQELDRRLTEDAPPLIVVAIDLDLFKQVNDMHGHSAGDALLVEMAKRLEAIGGRDGIGARNGGDEFILLTDDRPDLDAFGREITAVLNQPIKWEGQELPGSASCGLIRAPDHATTRAEVLTRADLALYRAKGAARGSHCVYSEDIAAVHRRRLSMLRDLGKAVSRNQFELHLQVQKNIADDTVTGFEALLRWHHPAHGLIPPVDFIPLAEETGLIVDIGNWVVETACAEAATWATPHTIAVNVAPRQLADANLPNIVRAALERAGLDPSRLELEITETSIIEDQRRAIATLNELRALGVGIVMDDYGIGYSSLAALKAFPFSKIKIDRGFVKNIETDAQAAGIVEATVIMARSLGMDLLAEGAETAAQIEILRAAGCTKVQGYYFGRPEPVAKTRARFHLGLEDAADQVRPWEAIPTADRQSLASPKAV